MAITAAHRPGRLLAPHRLLLTRPDALTDSQQPLLAKLTAACPEMTSLAGLVRSFATPLTPDPANQARLNDRTQAARAADLPVIHSFTRGPDLDMAAATAAITLPFHHGRTESVNTKTKMIKRQMHGRASFTLLRHKILPGSDHDPSPPKMRQSNSRWLPAPYRRENGGGTARDAFFCLVRLRP